MQTSSLAQAAGGSVMSDGSMSGMVVAGPGGSRSDSVGVSLSGDSFMYTQARMTTGAWFRGWPVKPTEKRSGGPGEFTVERGKGGGGEQRGKGRPCSAA